MEPVGRSNNNNGFNIEANLREGIGIKGRFMMHPKNIPENLKNPKNIFENYVEMGKILKEGFGIIKNKVFTFMKADSSSNKEKLANNNGATVGDIGEIKNVIEQQRETRVKFANTVSTSDSQQVELNRNDRSERKKAMFKRSGKDNDLSVKHQLTSQGKVYKETNEFPLYTQLKNAIKDPLSELYNDIWRSDKTYPNKVVQQESKFAAEMFRRESANILDLILEQGLSPEQAIKILQDVMSKEFDENIYDKEKEIKGDEDNGVYIPGHKEMIMKSLNEIIMSSEFRQILNEAASISG